VVAAVIEQDGRFLITRRLSGTHLAGYWEFPGGKVHEGETQIQALEREMLEELNTGILNARRVFHTCHEYNDRSIEIHFYRVDLTAEPHAMLGQHMRWIAREEFSALDFPPADAELIDRLVNASL
jgi:8-oxo-dGTP diphosphatase